MTLHMVFLKANAFCRVRHPVYSRLYLQRERSPYFRMSIYSSLAIEANLGQVMPITDAGRLLDPLLERLGECGT